jgi:hypothetical protein
MDPQNPDSSESQDTLESLKIIYPEPILDDESRRNSVVSTDPEREKVKPLSKASTFASSLGISGSGHSSAWYRKIILSHCLCFQVDDSTVTRLQRYSSYVFGIYTTFHITNTSIIPLLTRSVPASEKYLLLTRPYYQSFPLEPLLITLPITTHILAGLALRIHRRNANVARYGASNLSVSKRFESHVKVWPAMSWSSLSGYILVPLVAGHAFVNRTLPWIYKGGSSGVGLGFVSHGFARHPILAWGSYLALVGTAVGHIVWGVARWNGWVPVGKNKKAKRRRWTIHGIAAGFTALWMAGGLGVVGRGGLSEGWVGKGYDALYSNMPLVKL